MNDFATLIKTIGARQLAEEVGEKEATVQKWRQRNRIPPRCLRAVLAAAQKRGIILTAEKILDIAAAA